VAEGARGVWGWGHGTILLRMMRFEEDGVVSHPFRNERGMDGAPKSRPSKLGRGTQIPLIPRWARNGWGTRCGGAGQFYESKGAAGESLS
jgi:hypothetical protein